jgi:hypothetical protein
MKFVGTGSTRFVVLKYYRRMCLQLLRKFEDSITIVRFRTKDQIIDLADKKPAYREP